MEAINVDQLSHTFLNTFNEKVGEIMEADCIFIKSGISSPLDDEFRVVVEHLCADKENKSDHLVVLLETHGGYMETVERLVSVMRAHYDKVSFVIPNYAYSAGTVLALSGDSIYMDYYSVLGPIDPQYSDGKQLLPGAGYLSKYNELIKTINNPKNKSDAELAYLVKSFDPAKLFHIEQAINHGVSLISEWLPKYKFKNWTHTRWCRHKIEL